MSKSKNGTEKTDQYTIPSFRSVGSIPYDFHRLKYTTCFRNWHVKPRAKEDPVEVKLNLQLKLNKESFQGNPTVKTKKNRDLVDKWKQKQKEIQEGIYFQKRKSQDYLPEIRKHLFDIKDKIQVTKFTLPLQTHSKFPKVKQSETEKQELGKRRFLQKNSSTTLGKTYSLSLKNTSPLRVGKKKSNSNNLINLKKVEQMPARWETFQEEDWVADAEP